jgi:ATP-dependent Clp protease, protease subunit
MRNRLFNLFRINAHKGSIKADGNTIWLYDFIVSSEDDAAWFGGVSAEGFAKLIAQMTGPVIVRLNSPGGDVFGGRAIAQAIRGYDGEVTVQIDGVAASAASTIAVAGDKILIAPDGMMMIHRAQTITSPLPIYSIKSIFQFPKLIRHGQVKVIQTGLT